MEFQWKSMDFNLSFETCAAAMPEMGMILLFVFWMRRGDVAPDSLKEFQDFGWLTRGIQVISFLIFIYVHRIFLGFPSFFTTFKWICP